MFLKIIARSKYLLSGEQHYTLREKTVTWQNMPEEYTTFLLVSENFISFFIWHGSPNLTAFMRNFFQFTGKKKKKVNNKTINSEVYTYSNKPQNVNHFCIFASYDNILNLSFVQPEDNVYGSQLGSWQDIILFNYVHQT